MKQITIILFVHLFSLQIFSYPNNSYNQNLYYTCKVWGFLKYYHSEVAKGNINWDTKLFDTIESLKSVSTSTEFNQILLELIESAGQLTEPTTDPPPIPSEELSFNLDFNWIEDEYLSHKVKSELTKVKDWFRPQNNFYVTMPYFTPIFDNDSQFYSLYINQTPPEEYRLLAFFRYWNIIKYFNPYNNILDQNWDITLVQFIPKFIDANSSIDYNKTILELQTYINDTHGFTISSVIANMILGNYYLPIVLRFIENETVISRVFDDSIEIKPGDVIKSISGADIKQLRDSLKIFSAASNNSSKERNINRYLIRATQNNPAILEIQNSNGTFEATVERLSSTEYYDYYYSSDKNTWEILNNNNNNASFGYVDMGQLIPAEIEQMFFDLWNTDAIIFDIRNYPNATLWDMVKYLFDGPIQNADFTSPVISFPGTFQWHKETIGQGNFSSTYTKPIIILFNEETQSQAEYTVMSLEQHPKSIKIGSQTSGADGNVTTVSLPGQITLYFTSLGVFYPDKTPTQRIGIVPDIEVHPTIEGIREGRDEVLEVALQQIVTSVDDDNHQIYSYNLTQNFPNPFNPTTTLTYELAERSFAQIKIYDILGREITTLVNEVQSPGKYQIEFEGGSLSSGIYIYKLITESYVQTRKMVLLK